jgi:hypothetical protein
MVEVFVRLPRTLNIADDEDSSEEEPPTIPKIKVSEVEEQSSSPTFQKILKQKPK